MRRSLMFKIAYPWGLWDLIFQKGTRSFHDLLKTWPTPLFLLRWSPFCCFPDCMTHTLVFWSWMWCSLLLTCSAIAHWSVVQGRYTKWCSFILIEIDWPVCPICIKPHVQGVLYTPAVFNDVLRVAKETGNLLRQWPNFIVVPTQHPVDEDWSSVMCAPVVTKTSLKVERRQFRHHDVSKCQYSSVYF